MIQERRQLFTLHELLIMAALAALGGASGSALSNLRAALHAVVVLPGGMQLLAGIHVLGPVLAVGLVRKPGAAAVTGLFQGAVELLSGNPHGTIVLAYGGLAGVGVDTVWILLGGHHRAITYMLAGGVGSATNVLVFKFVTSLPGQGLVYGGLALMAVLAFISGSMFAGLLGWWLLRVLSLAGVVGARVEGPSIRGRPRARAGMAVLGAGIALLGAALYWAPVFSGSESVDDATAPRAAQGPVTTPQ